MDKITIGKRISARRDYLRFNQKDLAALLCVSRETISNWENGRRGIDADVIPALARALQVTFSDLLAEEDAAPTDAENEAEVLACYRSISPLMRAQALRILKTFLHRDPDPAEAAKAPSP